MGRRGVGRLVLSLREGEQGGGPGTGKAAAKASWNNAGSKARRSAPVASDDLGLRVAHGCMDAWIQLHGCLRDHHQPLAWSNHALMGAVGALPEDCGLPSGRDGIPMKDCDSEYGGDERDGRRQQWLCCWPCRRKQDYNTAWECLPHRCKPGPCGCCGVCRVTFCNGPWLGRRQTRRQACGRATGEGQR